MVSEITSESARGAVAPWDAWPRNPTTQLVVGASRCACTPALALHRVTARSLAPTVQMHGKPLTVLSPRTRANAQQSTPSYRARSERVERISIHCYDSDESALWHASRPRGACPLWTEVVETRSAYSARASYTVCIAVRQRTPNISSRSSVRPARGA